MALGRWIAEVLDDAEADARLEVAGWVEFDLDPLAPKPRRVRRLAYIPDPST
ncbi:MAG: hypothetical protein QM692_12860 [Thermomicrobiales bacterium]